MISNPGGQSWQASGVMVSDGSLLAVYDLGYYAPTFNVFEFLVSAHIFARRKGYEAVELAVVERPLSQAIIFQPVAISEYEWRLRDIVQAAALLFPATKLRYSGRCVEDVRQAWEGDPGRVFPPEWHPELSEPRLRAIRQYLAPFYSRFAHEAKFLPAIRVPFQAKVLAAKLLRSTGDRRPIVTITIRRTRYLDKRNSNIGTWRSVARHFHSRGYRCIWLWDIESPQAVSVSEGEDCAWGVTNLVLRFALYEAARLNFGVSNGPVQGLMFNPNTRFLIAKWVTDGGNAATELVENMFQVSFGGQLPWFITGQRIAWEDDADPDAIASAGETLLESTASLDRAAAPTLARNLWGRIDGNAIAPDGQGYSRVDDLQAFHDGGDFDLFRENWEGAVAAHPNLGSIEVLRAAVLQSGGDIEGAVRSVNRGLALDDGNPLLLARKAELLGSLRRQGEARAAKNTASHHSSLIGEGIFGDF